MVKYGKMSKHIFIAKRVEDGPGIFPDKEKYKQKFVAFNKTDEGDLEDYVHATSPKKLGKDILGSCVYSEDEYEQISDIPFISYDCPFDVTILSGIPFEKSRNYKKGNVIKGILYKPMFAHFIPLNKKEIKEFEEGFRSELERILKEEEIEEE